MFIFLRAREIDIEGWIDVTPFNKLTSQMPIVTRVRLESELEAGNLV